MGLAAIIRSGVALADSITEDLQCTVQHHPCTGTNAQAKPTHGSAVPHLAIVEHKRRDVRNVAGEVVSSQHTISFLRPLADTSVTPPFVRDQPIDPRDKIVLPDGTTGPIVAVTGFVDSGTGKSYYAQVYLG